MSGLADVVRAGVAIADSITASLQVAVTHFSHANATVDDSGYISDWGTGVSRQAVVDYTRRQIRDKEGRQVLSTVQIIFPRPVAVSPLDRFVFPDGTTHTPIDRAAEGVIDPDTGTGYYREVFFS